MYGDAEAAAVAGCRVQDRVGGELAGQQYGVGRTRAVAQRLPDELAGGGDLIRMAGEGPGRGNTTFKAAAHGST